MKQSTISKAEQLANSLIDSKLQEDNQAVKIIDPLLHLRNTTADFINQRFKKIQEDTELEMIAVEALKVKMKEGSVSFTDLANFLNQLKLRSTDATESLLTFFKPSQGESVPFISDINRDGNKAEDQIFQNATPQDLQALQKIIQLLESNKKEE